MTLGVLPLGRATFDVPFAEETLARMLTQIDAAGAEIGAPVVGPVVGPRALVMDADGAAAALADLQAAAVDRLLILQVTFTDAATTLAAAAALPDADLMVWAAREPRLGGRLRLNALCGLNLAAHALGRAGRGFGWLYGDAEASAVADLCNGSRFAQAPPLQDSAPFASARGAALAASLRGRRIARIGAHPEGFTTCAYDPAAVTALTGATVENAPLSTLFDAAETADAAAVTALRGAVAETLPNLDAVDQGQVDKSLRLKLALDALRDQGGYDAFALRCWPETFTEYGGALCGPASMLGEARVPCACEADVYGALTQLLLQETAQAPVFLVDLVDVDPTDDTAVVWHCGQAPLSMADPEAQPAATVHTNRKMPLLYEFPLKPGRATLVRLSQAHNTPQMVVAGVEVLRRPPAFTGTSGALRFDRPAGDVLADVIGSGLEHHMALAYGDHVDALTAAAAALGVPVRAL